MTVDERLSQRFRESARELPGFSEKKMMGGHCFFLNGNMLGGADRPKGGAGRFMFRVGKDNEAEALTRPGAEIVQFGNRRMGGLVFVDEAYCDNAALKEWIALACDFVADLPAK